MEQEDLSPINLGKDQLKALFPNKEFVTDDEIKMLSKFKRKSQMILLKKKKFEIPHSEEKQHKNMVLSALPSDGFAKLLKNMGILKSISLKNEKETYKKNFNENSLKANFSVNFDEEEDGMNYDRIKIHPANSNPMAGLNQEKTIAAENLTNMLKLREKYLFKDHQDYEKISDLIFYYEKSSEPIINYLKELPLLPKLENCAVIENDGVYEVEINGQDICYIPNKIEFIPDLTNLLDNVHKSINKSYTHNRLDILKEKFNIYKLYNSERESLQTQGIVHRDFYNCRKVDTHVHHAACMRAKQLLRFIIDKIESNGEESVILDKDKKPLTLNEITKKIGVSSKDINLDSLNVQADSSIFERFDRFNSKYNPLGVPELREIFLKSDNYIHGKYLAELTKEVMGEMEKEKYSFAEWRISIYGKSINEWNKLALWFKRHQIFSHQVRWMIQIPRLYAMYKKAKIVENFQTMIENIFKPLFDVTIDPSIDPPLHYFLLQVVGFDTVDDESIYETLSFEELDKDPREWNKENNPHYIYWIYYIYANLYSLNTLRKKRGLNTFTFRPHCGESGNIDHLATAFLVADGINHGIRLMRSPVLQYLYYLTQLGIAVSPLSNNKLFLEYSKNPFPVFFARGLNVSLSTDDPLIIHLTKEPLIEEYSVAAQVWNFSTVDLCEIARNSVIQCSFEELLKKHWIGKNYMTENDTKLTNVPNSRYLFRKETLKEEKDHLKKFSGIEETETIHEDIEYLKKNTSSKI